MINRTYKKTYIKAHNCYQKHKRITHSRFTFQY